MEHPSSKRPTNNKEKTRNHHNAQEEPDIFPSRRSNPVRPNLIPKEAEKNLNYKDLQIEIPRMWKAHKLLTLPVRQ